MGDDMLGRLLMGIRIGIAVSKRVKTDAHRKALMDTLLDAFGDGKMTEDEWVIVGGKLGVFDVED
jgi:hypothetical protein